jgi:hypothetical protein
MPGASETSKRQAAMRARDGRRGINQSPPRRKSKNEKRQKSADYCAKKSLFSHHHGPGLRRRSWRIIDDLPAMEVESINRFIVGA